MIAQGVQLMFLGMSVVFMFLILLVVCMNLTAAIVRVLPGQAQAGGDAGATGAFGTDGPSSTDRSSSAKVRAAVAAVSVHHNRR
jgi:sodium pump decarboxylase gamma subunit